MGIFDKIKGKGGKKDATKTEKPKVAKAAKAAPKKAVAKKADAAPKKEKVPTETSSATSSRKGGSHEASIILQKPLFTEKTDRMQAMGKYTFIVSPDANKSQVAQAIRTIYGVVPAAVHMSTTKGKEIHTGRNAGRRSDKKKAIVTLKKGEKLTVMQGA